MYVATMRECGGGGCCANDEYEGFDLHNIELLKTIRYPNHYQQAALEFAEKGVRGHLVPSIMGKGETPEEAWEACLTRGIEVFGEPCTAGVQNRFLWFVKYGANPEWANHQLRDLVRSKVDKGQGVWLGEFRNANTGNMVDGYMLTYHFDRGYEDDEYYGDEED